tara:strand:- start:26929 stop:27192 length:264 start_codon:yes stop_codon:yes gene_type:complete
MTVKELMELIGETRFNYVKNLIEDGMNEIQLTTSENVTQYTAPLTADQTAYNLPANLVQVKTVKIKDEESGYYCPIPRVEIDKYKEK